jgi:hypothetical protein
MNIFFLDIRYTAAKWLTVHPHTKIREGKSVTNYYKFSAELPSISEIQRLVAGYPDEEKLIEIISRSYDYIQKLPLKGTPDNYGQDDTSMAELA